MFTIEHEFDYTVITSIDEGDNFKDVEVLIDDQLVYIVQRIAGTEKNQVLELSHQQLRDLMLSMKLPEGAYYQEESLL